MSTLDATADRGASSSSPSRPRSRPGRSTSPPVPIVCPFPAPISSQILYRRHIKAIESGGSTRSLGSEKRSASFSLFPLCVSFHSSRFPKIFLPKHSDRSSSSAPADEDSPRGEEVRPRQRIKLSLFTAP